MQGLVLVALVELFTGRLKIAGVVRL